MSILVDEKTRLVVQGITGREGQFHAEQCMKYGVRIVGGVRPGKGGTMQLGVPVFDTMQQAVKKVKPHASIIFVPANGATDAVLEAADAKYRAGAAALSDRLQAQTALSHRCYDKCIVEDYCALSAVW